MISVYFDFLGSTFYPVWFTKFHFITYCHIFQVLIKSKGQINIHEELDLYFEMIFVVFLKIADIVQHADSDR